MVIILPLYPFSVHTFKGLSILKLTSILLVILSFSPNILKSQIINDTTLQWVAYLLPKDTFVYHINQKHIKLKGTDTTTVLSYDYDLTLEVLDSAKSEFKIKGLYSNFNVVKADPLTSEIIKAGEGLEVLYSTNNFGAFKEILNAGQISDRINKTYGQLDKKMGKDALAGKLIKGIMDQYATKEGIEAHGIDEIQFLHTGIGYQYVLGKDYEEDYQTKGIFTHQKIDAIRTFRLLEMDSIEKTGMIKVTTDFDSNQMRNETIQWLKSSLKKEEQGTFKEDTVPPMFVQSRLVNLFHYDYGWSLYAYHIKETEAGDSITQEITEIALK